MNPVLYFFSWLFQTFFRIFPVPSKTGLIKIGNPDSSSPVFLTGNFLLSVQRVKRAVNGMDAYLLVANTHGMNVWCGAAGGHFTHHAVISALKTTGIEKLVNHQTVVLPQLAAVGVEAKKILEKTGWKITWGPVDAKDIPAFLNNNRKKTTKLSTVLFPFVQRLEMAIFWAFPISVIISIVVLIFLPHLLLITNLLVWGLSFLLLVSMPVYSGFFTKNDKDRDIKKDQNIKKKKPLLSFAAGGLQVLLMLFITAGFYLYHYATGTGTGMLFVQEILLSFVIVILVTVDLTGLTPVCFSGILDTGSSVGLDKSRCKGEGTCISVCPKNCFTFIKEKPGIELTSPGSCVSCGACIVQCPNDALCFVTPEGKEIKPEVIRKYKLTLMGKRGKVQE